jgi:hypothetical protein
MRADDHPLPAQIGSDSWDVMGDVAISTPSFRRD